MQRGAHSGSVEGLRQQRDRLSRVARHPSIGTHTEPAGRGAGESRCKRAGSGSPPVKLRSAGMMGCWFITSKWNLQNKTPFLPGTGERWLQVRKGSNKRGEPDGLLKWLTMVRQRLLSYADELNRSSPGAGATAAAGASRTGRGREGQGVVSAPGRRSVMVLLGEPRHCSHARDRSVHFDNAQLP